MATSSLSAVVAACSGAGAIRMTSGGTRISSGSSQSATGFNASMTSRGQCPEEFGYKTGTSVWERGKWSHPIPVGFAGIDGSVERYQVTREIKGCPQKCKSKRVNTAEVE